MEEVISIRENIREHYKELFNNSLDIIYVIDIKGNFIDVNDIALETFAYKREEITDIMLNDLLDQEQTEKFLNGVKEIIKNGRNRDYIELKLKTKNGDAVYIKTYGIPIKGNGKICAIIGIANDVTARKQTELKLRESEERYRLIAENAIDMIGIINQNFEFEYINEKAAINLKGRRKGDLIGKNVSEVLHPDDIKKAYDALKKGFKAGEGKEEVRVRHKDDYWMWIDVKGKTYTNKQGDTYAIIIARDITERKKAEKKLEEFDNNLRKLVRELNCLYSISTIIDIPDISINEIIESILELIPHACQFPTLTCARIIYNDKKYETDNLRETKWKFSTRVIINEKPIMISVYFLENIPFLKSEIDLIKEIGNRLKIIIEQKESEQKLKQSEQRYRNIIENTKDVFVVYGIDGILKFSSPQLEKIVGRKIEPGTRIFKLIHPDDLGRLAELLRRFVREKRNFLKEQVEYRVLHRNGHYVWLSGSVDYYYDKDGSNFNLISTVRDITEKKHTEEKLRESEEKYRNILESIKEGYFEVDLKGNFTFINNFFCETMGYTKDEIEGINYRNFCNEETAKEIFKTYKKIYTTEKDNLRFEHNGIKKNGDNIILETSVYLRRDSQGKKIGFFGLSGDITDKKIAEQKLRESEEKYRTLVENSPNSITLLNNKGVIIDCNKETANLIGISMDKIIGNKYIDLFTIPKEKIPWLIETFKKAIKNDLTEPIEFEFKNKDGVKNWVESSVSLIVLDNETLIQIVSQDITSRKIAVQMLKDSEKKYRVISENAYDMITVINEKFEYEYINEKAHQDVLGYSKDELLGKPAIEKVHPDDVRKVIKKWSRGIKKGEETSELRFRKKDGTYLWLEVRGKLFKDSDGVFKGILIARDINKRKLAEEKLRESEEKYRLISENANDLVCVINDRFELEYVNEETQKKMTGYSYDDTVYQNIYELIHPDDRRKCLKEFRKGFKTGEGFVEARIRRKDGNYIWTESNGKMFIDKDKKPKILIIIRDITQKKVYEQKLQESEEKYRSILENMREGYIEVDLNQNFTFVNKRVNEFLGYSKDELYLMKINQVIVDKDMDNIIEKSKKLLKGEVDQILFEYETIPKEGPHKYIEASVNLKYDSQGNKVGFFGVYRDITEKKEANELIKKERQKLKELDLLKRDLTTQLSEKLKYPLSVISDVSEVLIESYQDQLDTNAQRLLELIREGGEKSTNMIERILDISKIESHKFELKKQIENINEIVNECIHETYENLKFREVGITLIVTEEFFAEVDKIRFKQIFEYFLISSMKNTPKQENISISLQKKDDSAEIRVKSHEIEIKYDEYPFEMQYSDDIMKLHQGVLLREFDRNERTRTITIMLPMINWNDKLIHLYVIYHSGILLYDHPFVIEGDPYDSLIISGGLIGMMNMLKEIIKGEQKVRTIDHGDRKIMFGLNSTEDVVFVLIVEEENPVVKKKLSALIEDFEDYYREQMKDIKTLCIMTNKWKGTRFLVKKHFKS